LQDLKVSFTALVNHSSREMQYARRLKAAEYIHPILKGAQTSHALLATFLFLKMP